MSLTSMYDYEVGRELEAEELMRVFDTIETLQEASI